jgi:hypothetical protein
VPAAAGLAHGGLLLACWYVRLHMKLLRMKLLRMKLLFTLGGELAAMSLAP